MRDSIALFVLSTLTEREREVLLRAYRLGYLSPRRKTSLRELSLEVGLAKPTTSIMVRKALRKLVQRVFETAT
ncbi:MAG: helix-turn-helix domain-containing protein [Desulfurococcaceae archaeon]